MNDRTVRTRWSGGMRAVTDIDGFEIVVDEPETHGGTGTGPAPTDLLLASVASCIALSVAFVARRRGVELPDLDVSVVGTYHGLEFERIAASISSSTPRAVLQGLLSEAERVCYVSNTLRHSPELVISVG
ncbi:OsmC family protein [Nocardioides sp.]|jgi:putative redox protein|uniref:OsmC family protein n=1 Tax=Nocardioides sp. TaxID=35761 RepID=UPI002F420CF8